MENIEDIEDILVDDYNIPGINSMVGSLPFYDFLNQEKFGFFAMHGTCTSFRKLGILWHYRGFIFVPNEIVCINVNL